MFYSQSFLTRKGPLGTVWCAAHLQHKLRKSHYISTNIPSTVERIIDLALPMALRISGHLLLGVVRIFSKQVDYFQEDCNVVLAILNRIITTATVNLPEDANRAPVHSITLPEKFNLDSIGIDDYFRDGYEDSHTKSHEDITLTEQIPTGRDPYIAITFDEHELISSSFTENISEPRDVSMEEGNVHSSVRPGTTAGFKNPSQHDGFDPNERESSPQNLPSIEIMRDAGNGFHFNGSPVLPDRAEPDRVLEEQFIKEKEASSTPIRDEVELPDAHFSSSHKHQQQNLSEHLNSSIFSEHSSPQMELQPTPTPTPAIAEQKIRKRKRKQLFDDTTVLSNKHMKKALNDTSSLCQVKRNCPSSSLDIWKISKRLKKDNVFYEPFVTGACAELRQIYNEDFVSNPHLVKSITDNAQQTIIVEPDLPRQGNDIEVPRNNEQRSPNMPPFSAAVPSPSGRSHFTPPEKSNSRVQSEHFEINEGTEMQHDTNVRLSAGNFDSETESPNTFHKEGFNIDNFDNSVFSDIPELVNSAGDLGFLEQDDYSSAGFQETAETGLGSKNQETPGLHHSLSSRTRAVVKYLKEQFPFTPISCNTEESLPGDLNLNKIMEGKSRKKCARIFYETLVLKHNDIIDVEQEKPFDDVILKVTPKLSKGDF